MVPAGGTMDRGNVTPGGTASAHYVSGVGVGGVGEQDGGSGLVVVIPQQ